MTGIILTYILMAISLVTIVISFIMSPNSNSFSGALVGSSDLELFKETKERGFKKWIKRIMFSLGIIMMIIAIVVRAVI